MPNVPVAAPPAGAPLYLGVDVGTSATKGVLADAAGRVLWAASASYRHVALRPLWAEQDPEDWWQAVAAVTRQLLAEHPGAAERVAAVGVSGQGVAAVLVDEAGRPVRPAILGLDARSAPQAARLDAASGARVAAVSGKRPAAYNMEPKLHWVREHEPAHWARTRQVLTTTAYVVRRLTGRSVMNRSDAGILLAYDLDRHRWSPELLGLMALPAALYPEVAACDAVVGRVTPAAASATGVPAGTPVVAGGEDTSSAGLAVGVLTPEAALLSLGTAGTVYVPAAAPVRDPRLLAFPHVIDGLTLVGGSMVAAGHAVAWAARLVGGVSPDAEPTPTLLEQLTREAGEAPPGADGLLFAPYLAGELQPVNDGFARGVFVGLTLASGRGHLVRAVLEGTAMAVRHNLAAAAEAGARVERLVAVGGPTRNVLWCQILADVTGLPLAVMEERGGAALGDAILAARGAGHLADLAAVQCMQRAHARVLRTHRPRAALAARYDRLYAAYAELHPRLRDVFPRLAEPTEGDAPATDAAAARLPSPETPCTRT